nr:hypothetical protein Itr_chr03CG08420 [Ipomoea trifida]
MLSDRLLPSTTYTNTHRRDSTRRVAVWGTSRKQCSYCCCSLWKQRGAQICRRRRTKPPKREVGTRPMPPSPSLVRMLLATLRPSHRWSCSASPLLELPGDAVRGNQGRRKALLRKRCCHGLTFYVYLRS